MIEDKLTQRQRIRLEALAQAVISCPPSSPSATVLNKADDFANFIQEGKTND